MEKSKNDKPLTEERFWELLQAIAWEIDGYPYSDMQSSIGRAKMIIEERDAKNLGADND